MHDDSELLRRYADSRSEEAFAQFVDSNLGLVYQAALRRTNGDTHLAEDVVQQVFSSAAKNARSIARHSVPAGWLYVATRNAAANLMRAERRRKAREQKAFDMHDSTPETGPTPNWGELRLQLDAVLDSLDPKDRDAVLLRCLQGRPFSEVGGMLHSSEDAARKRVDRALEKLRGLLAGRGITSTSAALAAALAGQAGIAAPAGLAARVSGLAMASAGSHAAILMSTTKVGVVVAVAILIAAGGSLYVQHRHEVQQRQNAVLTRAQIDRRATQIDPSTAAFANAANSSAPVAVSGGAVRKATPASKPGASGGAPWPALTGGMVRSADWRNRGTATALDAFESYEWAVDHVDVDVTGETIGFGKWRTQVDAFYATLPDSIRSQYDSPEKFWAMALTGAPHASPITSFGVMSQAPDPADPDNGVVMQVVVERADGLTLHGDIHFEQTPNGWRYVLQDNLIGPLIDAMGRPK